MRVALFPDQTAAEGVADGRVSRGEDLLRGDAGDDELDGSLGNDTAVYSGNQVDYSVAVNEGVLTITDLRANSPDGTDSVWNVESFQFANGSFTTCWCSLLGK